jgi:aspartate racemase
MKHIGIVDITTIGACICINEIVSEAARQDSSGKHPEFTMHAFSFDIYKKLIVNQDWKNLAEVILESINTLKSISADFIIIPSNTPHFAIDIIQVKSPLPVLNLIEITANECQRRGCSRVAVLGTKFTMQGKLYDQLLRDRYIIPLIPNDMVCERIHNLIMNEIISSKINPQTVEQVKLDIQKLECDTVILGCTELPEVYNKANLGVEVIDTTRLIAHAALEFAKKL